MKSEIKRFEDHRIDIEALLQQGRDAERIRSQMVLLERRVQVIVHKRNGKIIPTASLLNL